MSDLALLSKLVLNAFAGLQVSLKETTPLVFELFLQIVRVKSLMRARDGFGLANESP